MSDNKVAVITGANRGIGLEIARQLARDYQFHVVLGARDGKKGNQAAEELIGEKLKASFFPLDILSEESVRNFAKWLESEKKQVDVLINNAGILLERTYTETENIEVDGLEVNLDTVGKVLDTNLLGTLRVIQNLVPLIPNGGRIVNLSSRMGQFEWADTNMIGYRLSKTALNGLTASLAVRLADRNISVNCLCPGWVLTDMGSKFAQISVQEGAGTAVWLAAVADSKLTGKFFYEKKEIPW